MKPQPKGKFKVGYDPRRVKGFFKKGYDPRRHKFTFEECQKGGYITSWCYIHGPWSPPFPPYMKELARAAWQAKFIPF